MEGEAKGPTYAAAFECLGPACEDHCCRGWGIPVDRGTYAQYVRFPAEGLGEVVARSVVVSPAGAPEEMFAEIKPLGTGLCPFFGADRLCGIQKEYGGSLLSATCSIFPRALNRVEGRLEGSLMMSCPEAARKVLLQPGFLEIEGDLNAGAFRTDNSFCLGTNGPGLPYKPYEHYGLIRRWMVATVKDRSRPLWQRVLLIGYLCLQLQAAEAAEGVPAMLAEYGRVLASDWGMREFAAMEGQPETQLNAILWLTNQRIALKGCGTRFQETYWAFIEGIGSPLGAAPPGDDLLRYQEATRQIYKPFFARQPHVLENYLLNAMFQNLFPFGNEGSLRSAPRSIVAEYLLMATKFAWVKGLMIGVAGRYGEDFGEEQVVRTIQSFSREVEHDGSFLETMMGYMREQGMDNLKGVAVMLKE